ncbi:MAG: hypothetical protein JWQ97_2233 [Phenylobacterium sp.]|nr:hypothetical protein [Phenylobacterium sp.]
MARADDPNCGVDDQALGEPVAQTGPGLPDEAIGPEQRTISEELELAESEEGRRIEQKLRAELLARGLGDEEAAAADPTGHA